MYLADKVKVKKEFAAEAQAKVGATLPAMLTVSNRQPLEFAEFPGVRFWKEVWFDVAEPGPNNPDKKKKVSGS